MKRDEKKKANKQKIIDAAYILMMTDGVKNTSVRDVAKKSGISYVTMYKYFEDKEALVSEVVLKLFNNYSNQLMDIVKTDMDFWKKLEAFSKNANQMQKDLNPELFHCFFKVINGTGEVAEHASAVNNELWKTLIKDGRESGAITIGVSDDSIIMFSNMFIRYVNNPANNVTGRYYEEFERLFANSLKK